MKKKALIIGGIVVAVLVVIAIIALSTNKSEKAKVEDIDLSSTTGAEAFINKVYEPIAEQLPNLLTSVIDLSDVNSLTYYTGLTSTEGIEYAVASEPMMSSQAYSFVLVKVSEDADVQKIKQDIFDKVDTRKWICVEAENKYATDYDNTVIFLMGAKDFAVSVYDRITEVLGKAMGSELKYEAEANIDQFENQEDGEFEAYPGEEVVE